MESLPEDKRPVDNILVDDNLGGNIPEDKRPRGNNLVAPWSC